MDMQPDTQPKKVGSYIASLRKAKQFTQTDLGERLHISPQAVSKWERGEGLPDTSILVALAQVLGTTVDSLLKGGDQILPHKGQLAVKDMIEAIHCLQRMGFLLGQSHPVYRHAIDGISQGINGDVDAMLADDYQREALIMEAILQQVMNGYYFDPVDVKNHFRHQRWHQVFVEYVQKNPVG